MVLRVPFDQFAQTVRRCTGGSEAYLCHENGNVLATAGDPAKGYLIAAAASETIEEARKALAAAGLEVRDGRWTTGEAGSNLAADGDLQIAAIAYRCGMGMPGLWVDAFAEPVLATQALRSMYDEFVENGEIGDVSFEEFLRAADANVVMLSIKELEAFASQKTKPCD